MMGMWVAVPLGSLGHNVLIVQTNTNGLRRNQLNALQNVPGSSGFQMLYNIEGMLVPFGGFSVHLHISWLIESHGIKAAIDACKWGRAGWLVSWVKPLYVPC